MLVLSGRNLLEKSMSSVVGKCVVCFVEHKVGKVNPHFRLPFKKKTHSLDRFLILDLKH